MERNTMEYDASRFKTLFEIKGEGAKEMEEGAVMVFRSEIYDEELALEREEQEFEERNLGKQQLQGGSASFICRHCPEVFLSKKDLAAHRPIHRLRNRQKKSTSELTCDTCGKVFQRRNALVDHMNSHNSERNYPCPECPARFVQRSNRDCHLRNTHMKEYLHSCTEPGCERRFQQKRERDQHIKTVHRKERNFVCDTCKASFSHPVNYRKHLASHTAEKNYSCPICGKLFGRAENRDVHLFVHSISKAYVCSVCGADYMRRNQLIRHSSESGHSNDRIERQKPLFSPALAQRPAFKDQLQKDALLEDVNKSQKPEFEEEDEFQWLEEEDRVSPGDLEDSQGERILETEKMTTIFTEDVGQDEFLST
ncbi:gastrula zinc finger protein XlCGF8.2DB [Drosophila rhopaloa]|uniref:Gastrula zinc finger protein XlCGF8.2DB n=1 Tax=Drosophila rhopaloa TaxID=1041015 RepID=A0A6P4F818_DRORH|nr:gastrula zinc finger protein XlCGF8.2DB [Drosophila rhopaloa]